MNHEPFHRHFCPGRVRLRSPMAHDPSEKVTVLQDQMLQNAPGKKAMMIEVDYKPGQSSIAHKHDGTAMAYVLEGEVTSQVKGEKPITYKAGEFGTNRPVPNTWCRKTPAKANRQSYWCSWCWRRTKSADPFEKLMVERTAINKKAQNIVLRLFISPAINRKALNPIKLMHRHNTENCQLIYRLAGLV
jgi:hypothetical protein